MAKQAERGCTQGQQVPGAAAGVVVGAQGAHDWPAFPGKSATLNTKRCCSCSVRAAVSTDRLADTTTVSCCTTIQVHAQRI
jgi:hypothetical protein